MIESLTGQGFSEREACRALAVNRSSYVYWRKRPPHAGELRRAWLGPLVAEIHEASFGTYGYRRVSAELRLGHNVIANHKLVHLLMVERGLKGLPRRTAARRGIHGAFIAADLVKRDFSGDGPNRLWVTDITEHPTREGKVFCCAVLDAFSRMVVGWSIDSTQTAALVTNALAMAIAKRDPDQTVIHSDRGTQFTSWTFTQRIRDAGLMPSVGRTGTALDNAMMESFWGGCRLSCSTADAGGPGSNSPMRSSNTSSRSTIPGVVIPPSICSPRWSSRSFTEQNPASWILIWSGQVLGADPSARGGDRSQGVGPETQAGGVREQLIGSEHQAKCLPLRGFEVGQSGDEGQVLRQALQRPTGHLGRVPLHKREYPTGRRASQEDLA